MKIVLFTTSDMRGPRRSELYRMLASTGAPRNPDVVHYLLLQNGTSDDEADVRAHSPASVRISRIPGRLGISAARNVMLDKAMAEDSIDDGDIVGFPDDDCWFPPEFLPQLYSLHEEKPDLDLLVTRCDLFPDLGPFGVGDCRPAKASEVVRKSSSNSMFLRGRIVRELKHFDETLGLGTPARGGEDTDFALRAYLSGRFSAFIDRALIGHPAPTADSAAKYYHGALLVLAGQAGRSGEVRREFARKLAVGAYFTLRGNLSPRTYLASLKDMTHSMRKEWKQREAASQAKISIASKRVEADEITILYCVDSRYLNQACVSLASLLASNPDTPIAVTIAMLDRVDAEALRAFSKVLEPFPLCRIRFRDIDLATFSGLPTTSRFSASVYGRIVLARFMDPVHKRVLYLDADTIVESDLRPLWTQNLNGKAIAAVRDRFRLDMEEIGFEADEPYFNSGVILFDMEAWRARDYEARVLDLINRQGENFPWMDQDALNIALRGDVAFVDDAWNFQPRCADVPASFLGLSEEEYRAARVKPRIIHYTTSLKPWNAAHMVHYSDRFFKMARLAGLEAMFASTKPRSLSQRSQQVKTWMRWRYPRVFRLVRTVLRPQAAAMMYRAR